MGEFQSAKKIVVYRKFFNLESRKRWQVSELEKLQCPSFLIPGFIITLQNNFSLSHYKLVLWTHCLTNINL